MRNVFLGFLITVNALASDITRGNQVDAVFRDAAPLYEDREVCERVNSVGQKVVAASGNELGFTFRFYVLNVPDITTFSAPGGSVYITTGLLRHLRSEDELAVMLGHEIAHINKRHMMRTEYSEHAKVFWGRVLVVGAVAGGQFAGAVVAVKTAKALTSVVAITQNGTALTEDQAGQELANLTANAVTWGTAFGGTELLNMYYQGFKDTYEFEADRLAIDYARKAGYDGGAMVRVLERLSGANSEAGANEIARLHSSEKSLSERTVAAGADGGTTSKHNP